VLRTDFTIAPRTEDLKKRFVTPPLKIVAKAGLDQTPIIQMDMGLADFRSGSKVGICRQKLHKPPQKAPLPPRPTPIHFINRVAVLHEGFEFSEGIRQDEKADEIFTSNCYDGVMKTSPQQALS